VRVERFDVASSCSRCSQRTAPSGWPPGPRGRPGVVAGGRALETSASRLGDLERGRHLLVLGVELGDLLVGDTDWRSAGQAILSRGVVVGGCPWKCRHATDSCSARRESPSAIVVSASRTAEVAAERGRGSLDSCSSAPCPALRRGHARTPP